jgi:hypothetical protein
MVAQSTAPRRISNRLSDGPTLGGRIRVKELRLKPDTAYAAGEAVV